MESDIELARRLQAQFDSEGSNNARPPRDALYRSNSSDEAASLALARRLQAQFDSEGSNNAGPPRDALYRSNSSDEAASLDLARRLQQEFEGEAANDEMAPFLPPEYRTPSKRRDNKPMSCVSEEWETIDPTPDLHALFLEFNQTFFWGKLLMCEVKWSPRMYKCAGICRYFPRERFCTIGISIPLLKLRPRKDLVETLLHEMIHAFLFVTDNNDDHDGHGPEFHKHMYRINAATGAGISVYHTFHDEVELYKTHWWRCDGPCTKRPPFYGFVKRPMNRAPGPNDRWWGQHQNTCGGSFIKVKEPEGFGQKKGKKKEDKPPPKPAGKDIREMFGKGKENKKAPKKSPIKKDNKMPKGLWDANVVPKSRPGGGGTVNGLGSSNTKPGSGVNGGRGRGNIFGFGGSSSSPSARGGGTSRSGGGPGVSGGGGRGNMFGFGGTSFGGPSRGGGGLQTRGGRSGTVVIPPGRGGHRDNSSGGSVISGAPAHHVSASGGHRLGSSGDVTSGSQSARDAVRRRWAEASGSGGSSGVSNVTSGDKEEDKVPCPVCNKSFKQAEINPHLDNCLGAPDDDMDDGDDEFLLSASIEIENSVNNSQAAVLVVSDSEDDEPLIKRRIRSEDTAEDDHDQDLMSQQDDQDILAALENTETLGAGDESMFACPICEHLVTHGEMFSHLDQCTQNI